MNNQVTSDQVISNIEEKEELLARKQGLISSRGASITQLHSISHKLISARQTVNSYKSSRDPKHYENQLRNAEFELDSLLKQQDEFETKIQHMEDELCEVNHKLDRINTRASAEEILHYIQKVDDAKGQIAKIESLINENQATINNLVDKSDEDLAKLQEKRASILADMSMGEAKQSDLDAIDSQINDLVEKSSNDQFDSAPAIRDAQQSIKGLIPKLEQANSHLAKLIQNQPKIVEGFLIEQANQIGKKFVVHAQKLINEFTRLKAIEEIRKRKGLDREGVYFTATPMNFLRIPTFALDCFEDVKKQDVVQQLLYSDFPHTPERNAELNEAFYEELKRYREIGLGEIFDSENN